MGLAGHAGVQQILEGVVNDEVLGGIVGAAVRVDQVGPEVHHIVVSSHELIEDVPLGGVGLHGVAGAAVHHEQLDVDAVGLQLTLDDFRVVAAIGGGQQLQGLAVVTGLVQQGLDGGLVSGLVQAVSALPGGVVVGVEVVAQGGAGHHAVAFEGGQRLIVDGHQNGLAQGDVGAEAGLVHVAVGVDDHVALAGVGAEGIAVAVGSQLVNVVGGNLFRHVNGAGLQADDLLGGLGQQGQGDGADVGLLNLLLQFLIGLPIVVPLGHDQLRAGGEALHRVGAGAAGVSGQAAGALVVGFLGEDVGAADDVLQLAHLGQLLGAVEDDGGLVNHFLALEGAPAGLEAAVTGHVEAELYVVRGDMVACGVIDVVVDVDGVVRGAFLVVHARHIVAAGGVGQNGVILTVGVHAEQHLIYLVGNAGGQGPHVPGHQAGDVGILDVGQAVDLHAVVIVGGDDAGIAALAAGGVCVPAFRGGAVCAGGGGGAGVGGAGRPGAAAPGQQAQHHGQSQQQRQYGFRSFSCFHFVLLSCAPMFFAGSLHATIIQKQGLKTIRFLHGRFSL